MWHLVQLRYILPFFMTHRINFFDFDPSSSNTLALNVGKNSGSLWSNIATLPWPNGLAGPPGEALGRMHAHVFYGLIV